MDGIPQAGRRTYLGLFTVALATLTYEILLTRVFSVTLWYHFAFMAISVAMFGMTVGALFVYLRPGAFPNDRLGDRLALASWLFAVTGVAALVFHVFFHAGVASTYVAVSIPFAFSGVAVSLALTRYPAQLGALYASDLVGAATGCLLVVPLLAWTDGPTAVVVSGSLASLAGAFFCQRGGRRLPLLTLGTALALGVLASVHTVRARTGRPLLRLTWVKGRPEKPPLYERWNSFSRVTVQGNPDWLGRPTGWGMSGALPPEVRVRQLYVFIDSTAGTVMTQFEGDLAAVDFLRFDLTNIVHHIRPHARVLVVGTGGGRDVLSALVFGQASVTGVELNENVLDAVNRRFGDFTGHLDRDPRVSFVNDEARSWVTRTSERFDVIEVSLIDTWAATAAGAFVLSESTLYTVEAWRTFLAHLTPRGVLTFSRWYFRGRPGEVYRLAALAGASLRGSGVADPRAHVVILRRMYGGESADRPDGIGTILVSPSPFSGDDLDTLARVCRDLGFEPVLTPRSAIDPVFERLVAGRDLEAVSASLPINVTPPTDDSPFFFHMLRLRDIFRSDRLAQGAVTFNMEAVATLGVLLITVFGLTVLCVLVPLLLTADRSVLRGNGPLFVFFAGIGFGFMVVEISQMQRLVVFLGHPTYGLTVVLFTLLLASGLGSWASSRIPGGRPALLALVLLLVALVVFGLVTPRAAAAFAGSPAAGRIGIAVATLFPLGLLMGTAFPLGMREASSRAASLTPWLWGMNGAASVCGSVLAVALGLSSGISASFWTGAAFYAAAGAAYAVSTRRP